MSAAGHSASTSLSLQLRRWPPAVAVVRSTGLWALPALLVIELVNATARGQIWAIEWQWTAYWSNAATYLAGPLLAGIAAADSLRYRRNGSDGVLGLGSERLWAHLLRGLAIGWWGVVAHLVGVLTCAAAAARIHHDLALPVGPTLPAFVALVAWGLLGSAIGWLWPSPAAPPVVAVVGVAVTSLSALPLVVRLNGLLRVETATGSLLGLATRPTATVADMLWWGALGLFALRLLARPDRTPRPCRRRRAWLWDGVLLAAMVVAGAVALSQGAHRFAASGEPVPRVCSSTLPPLCVNAEYASRLPVYARTAAALSRAIRQLDPTAAPIRLEQDGRVMAGSPPADGTVTVGISERGRVDSVNLAFDLVQSATGCGSAENAMDQEVGRDEDRLVSWLTEDAHLAASYPLPDSEQLRSAAEARALLATLRAEC